MLSRMKKVVSASLAVALLVGVMAMPAAAAKPAIGSAPNKSTDHIVDHGIPYPYPLQLKKDQKADALTLDYLMELTSNVSGSGIANVGDNAWAKAYQKATGVTIKFTHYPAGQINTNYLLRASTNNLGDVFEGQHNVWYPSGGAGLIKDKVAVDIQPYRAKGQVPFLDAYLRDNPIIEKQLKTDDGQIYNFPFIRGNETLLTTSGMMLRKDWLDELKLSVPETLDEWETVLTAFKNKGVSIPLANGGRDQYLLGFGSAFNLRNNFFVKYGTGKIAYAPYDPEYIDYIMWFNSLYNKGLIDTDWNLSSRNATLMATNMSTGVAGACYAAGGGGIGTYTATARGSNPTFELVAAPWPVKKKGDPVRYSGSDNYFVVNSSGNTAISTKSKKIDLALQLLDFAYSPQGHLLMNFGTEGVSYNMVDGKAVYTDVVLGAKADAVVKGKTLSVAQGMSWFGRGNYNGPFVQDTEYLTQFWSMPEQKNAMVVWTKNKGSNATILPPLSHTGAEINSQNAIWNDINTYVEEQAAAMIRSAKLTRADVEKFQAQLKKMNVEQAIRNKQAAYDRYLKR